MSQSTPGPRPGAPAAGQLPIELPDDVAQGTYSNLIFISHSPSEFVVDFARALPGVRKGRVRARVIMTPQHAKALSELLKRNVATWEETHGPIPTPGRGDASGPIGFVPSPSEPAAGREGSGDGAQSPAEGRTDGSR
jgi:hypothetical protein